MEGKGESSPPAGSPPPAAQPKFFVGQGGEAHVESSVPVTEGQKIVPPGVVRAVPAAAAPAPAPTPVPVVPPPAALPRQTAPPPGTGGELPSIQKPDVQLLLQDLAAGHRTLYDERRKFERDLAYERERARYDQERIRDEYGARQREVERQNEVLIRNLGRLQGDNDALREELAVLRSKMLSAPAPAAIPAEDPATGKARPVVGPTLPLMTTPIPFQAPPPVVPRRP